MALYTLLNGALTVWLLYVERGTVYVGTSPGGETVRITTGVRKNVPVYEVTVEVSPAKGKGNGKKEVVQVKRAFTEWFDGAGRFVAAPFQGMLAGSFAVVGKADPKRAAAAAGAGEGKRGEEGPAAAVYTPEMLEMLAKADVSVVGSAAEEVTGSEAAGKKGGKRRKA